MAVTMLAFTAITVYTVSNWAKALMASSDERATAMFLSQEWIEFVRNLRDARIWQNTNRTNWRDKFLTEDAWFLNIQNKWKTIKKIWKNNWIFTLDPIPNNSFLNKKISSIDQICTSFYDNCDFEVIKIKEKWERKWDVWDWGIFFRKITFEKEDLEKNLITIQSSIYRDYKWELQNFSLEAKLWNLTIY